MSNTCFTAAAIQLCAGSDKAANLDKAESLVAEAAQHGALLVVLPEVFAWRGEREREQEMAEPVPGPTSQRLAGLAAKLAVHLVGGSILEASDESRPYNTSLLFNTKGDLVARYRKLHLFDVDLPGQVTVRESASL